jgi:hypothetical protein
MLWTVAVAGVLLVVGALVMTNPVRARLFSAGV